MRKWVTAYPEYGVLSPSGVLVLICIFGFMNLTGMSARAQIVTQDWKLHNVGSVIQLVTNRGKINKYGIDYPGLIKTGWKICCH